MKVYRPFDVNRPSQFFAVRHQNGMSRKKVTTPSFFRPVARHSAYQEEELQTTPLKTPKTPSIPTTPRIEAGETDPGSTPTNFLALIENASREVGIAVITVSPPSLSLFQFSDTPFYSNTNNLVNFHRPTKIVVPGNAAKSQLTQFMLSQQPADQILELQRSRFSDAVGSKMLQEFGHTCNDDQLHNRYLAISAAAAVLFYVQSDFNIEIFHHSLQIDFKPLEGHLLIDSLAFKQFSIFSVSDRDSALKLSTPKHKLCLPTLFNLINFCHIPSGARCLRAILASPPSDIDQIKLRQDFVEEVVLNDQLYNDLALVFGRILDLDPALTFLVTKGTTKLAGSSIALDSLQRLHLNSRLIKGLMRILASMHSDLAQQMVSTVELAESEQLGQLLDHFLAESTAEVQSHSAQIFAIKPKVIGILDVTRKCYEDSLSEIHQLGKTLSEKYDIKISVKYNKSRRFHFWINKGQLKKRELDKVTTIAEALQNVAITASGFIIPSEFIHVVESPSYITASTYELLLLNKKNESAENDTLSISDKFIDSKVEDVRPFVRVIYKVSEIIGVVDSLLSLATVARSYSGYVKPTFSENRTLTIRGARHPILEQLIASDFVQKSVTVTWPSRVGSFVANDFEMSESKHVMIVRGVNMSGKSTVLQTLVQIAILSQCGSFVPCESAALFPFTSVLIRSGTNESLEGNASAFFTEMKEMSEIIAHATEMSLIAIDEPCVSTSVRDGIGLSFACLETLIVRKSFVLCATHFTELEALASLYSSVAIKEMRTRERSGENRFEFLYQIGDGSNAQTGYGIKIAADFLPSQLIADARAIHGMLSAGKSASRSNKATGDHAKAAVLQRLLTLQSSTLDDESLIACLKSLKSHCRMPA
jgi:DNA mismatch repair protein MSH4